jgi:aminopeptidase N
MTGTCRSVTTPQFIALAQQLSGRDLGAFFDTWLHQPGKPATW